MTDFRQGNRVNERIRRLQALRDCALAISDRMSLSPGGDEYVYEGGTDLIDMFRNMECEMVSFEHSCRSPQVSAEGDAND
jgi:hypothetical protein